MQAGIYRHYKGQLYQVLGIAEHTERKEKLVIYVALEGVHLPGPRIRARPLDGYAGFNTPVRRSSELEAEKRFTYVGDEIPRNKARQKKPSQTGPSVEQG